MRQLDEGIPQAWLLFRGTWRRHVTVRDPWGQMSVSLGGDPRFAKYAANFLQLYAWNQHDDLAQVLCRVQVPHSAHAQSGLEHMRKRLQYMASDLKAMRPLLIRSHRISRTLTQVGPDLWIGWVWTVGNGPGAVACARSEREFLEGERRLFFRAFLNVGEDGSLGAHQSPWLRAYDLPDAESAVAANLAVLERLYEQELRIFAKLNVNAILAKYQARAESVAGEAPSDYEACADEVLAAAALLADPIGADLVGADVAEQERPASGGSLRRVKGIRFLRFIGCLERMGCEVRQGKGSEVNVYRPGELTVRLGRHVRNGELSPVLVRVALRQLGFSVDEFLAQVG